MANTASKVIKVAEAEVGYLEKKSNSKLNSKTANAGSENYTKYGKWFGMSHAYWCAMFVSWCFNKAYGETAGKKLMCGGFSASCETIRERFKDKKQYYTSKPQVGDLIFFDGSRHSGANHIGIVYKVSGSTVYTIEGNTSGGSTVIDNGGGVAKKSYSVHYARILGYGRPKYDKDKKAKKTSTKKATTTSESSVYYKKYKGTSKKIDVVLKAVGVPASAYGSWVRRKSLAKKNGIENYTGTAAQNTKLIALAKKGKLKK